MLISLMYGYQPHHKYDLGEYFYEFACVTLILARIAKPDSSVGHVFAGVWRGSPRGGLADVLSGGRAGCKYHN